MFNKGNVLAAGLLVAGSLALVSSAHAGGYHGDRHMRSSDNWMDNTYVGFDIVKSSIDFTTDGGVDYNAVYHSDFTGLNPYVGYRFDDSWSAELGYVETNDKSKTVSTTVSGSISATGSTKAELRSWHLDGIYNYDFADDFSALALVGIERAHLKTTTNLTTTANIKASQRDTAMRVGLGLAFRFNDDLSARVMAKYADTDFDDVADSTMHYSIGLTYDF
jgi:opacity protein-like surface antigen